MSEGLPALSPIPVVFDALALRIDRDDVLRFQGYKKGRDVPAADVQALLDEALALGGELMRPRVVYRAVVVTGQGDHLIEAGGEALHIPEIGRRWGRLEVVGAAICTIGDLAERRVEALFERREFPLAMMLDSVSSAAVEGLAESANDLLCQQALSDGRKVTNRISPGYAGWDTAEQERIFRLCPGSQVGVTLNSASFMTPVKSISFLVGIGAEARVDDYFTQCRRCWLRDCAFRRAPVAPAVPR